MSSTVAGRPAELLTALRRELFALAKREDDAAADEAARTPYWQPCPTSVGVHRQAAELLRAEAEKLDALCRLAPAS